ncbi:MAG: 50S ribosomal protein L25 [Acidobacteriota bacterium]
MASNLVIRTERREELGKNASRRLRSAGMVPAILYGGAKDPVPLMVHPTEVQQILRSGSGENALFGITISGKKVPGQCMIKEQQVDPVTERLVHADFMQVAMDRAVRVHVAVHSVGTARGVKLQGGILDHPLREIELECLPGNIPEGIEVDITDLDLGQSIRVGDLKFAELVKCLTDPSMPVVAVVAPSVEKVEEAPAEGEVEAGEPTAEPEAEAGGKDESK